MVTTSTTGVGGEAMMFAAWFEGVNIGIVRDLSFVFLATLETNSSVVLLLMPASWQVGGFGLEVLALEAWLSISELAIFFLDLNFNGSWAGVFLIFFVESFFCLEDELIWDEGLCKDKGERLASKIEKTLSAGTDGWRVNGIAVYGAVCNGFGDVVEEDVGEDDTSVLSSNAEK